MPTSDLTAAPDPSSPHVLLYTRSGCHLCELAYQTLVRHDLAPQRIDIDSSRELQQRYTNCVPVVIIDGKERFRGRIDEFLLQRLLTAR